MKIKFKTRYHYTPIKMTNIYKSDHTQSFQNVEQQSQRLLYKQNSPATLKNSWAIFRYN